MRRGDHLSPYTPTTGPITTAEPTGARKRDRLLEPWRSLHGRYLPTATSKATASPPHHARHIHAQPPAPEYGHEHRTAELGQPTSDSPCDTDDSRTFTTTTTTTTTTTAPTER